MDLLVAMWAVGWVGVGVWTGIDVWHLDRLATTLATAAAGLHDAATALGRLSALPFVGSSFRHLAAKTSATAASAAAGAATARSSVHQLAYLIGAAVALAPSVPVAAAWLLARSRLARGARDPGPVENRA